MRVNERMQRALARVPARAVLHVARRFGPVLDAGIVNEEGCIYLAYCRARVALPAGLDETGRNAGSIPCMWKTGAGPMCCGPPLRFPMRFLRYGKSSTARVQALCA